MDVSTITAVGILQGSVFLLVPSVPRTENGLARESLLRVVGRHIYTALEINAAYLAVSSTLPPPKPITIVIFSIRILFASADALSKSAPVTRKTYAPPKS